MNREKVIMATELLDDFFNEYREVYYISPHEAWEIIKDTLKEQETKIKNRDESLEKAREEIKWLRGMLKEQEAVEPTIDEYGNKRCGSCGCKLQSIFDEDLFCRKCGQAVKWE